VTRFSWLRADEVHGKPTVRNPCRFEVEILPSQQARLLQRQAFDMGSPLTGNFQKNWFQANQPHIYNDVISAEV